MSQSRLFPLKMAPRKTDRPTAPKRTPPPPAPPRPLLRTAARYRRAASTSNRPAPAGSATHRAATRARRPSRALDGQPPRRRPPLASRTTTTRPRVSRAAVPCTRPALRRPWRTRVVAAAVAAVATAMPARAAATRRRRRRLLRLLARFLPLLAHRHRISHL